MLLLKLIFAQSLQCLMTAKLRMCVALLCLVSGFYVSVGTAYSASDGANGVGTHRLEEQNSIPVPTPRTLFEDIDNLPEPDYRGRYFAVATGILFVLLIATIVILSYRRYQINNRRS